MRIGFIGLGTMGSAAAANIRRAGYDLVVHDLREELAAPLCAEGAQWAETPRSCGDKCDVVFTMVFGPEQVQTLMRGDSGLMEGLRPGSVWVDMTTNRPSLVRALADELAVRGIETIDAPVSGAVDGARRGELTLFVGGSDQAVE